MFKHSIAGIALAVLAGATAAQQQPAKPKPEQQPAARQATISLAAVAGKWRMRATDLNGANPVEFELTATTDSDWIIVGPNRPPIHTRIVSVAGDSIVAEAGPYESFLLKGVQVRQREVYRLQGARLASTLHVTYATARGDSTSVRRTSGTRVAESVGMRRNAPARQRERVVPIGGLFALTGGWSTEARATRAAMELAVDDVNRYLEGNTAGIRFVAAVEDTRLDPAVALEKAKALRNRGAQLLIGPQSSAEVAYLKPYVDANGLLLVSPASTAGTLAIAGDNIFRFTPSDSLEGVAISALMWEDGVRVVVPVWRDDAGGIGLEHATRARFTSLGGAVLAGVKYAPATTDFSTVVAAVGAQVRQAMGITAAEVGGRSAGAEATAAENVAVYLAGFDEVAAVFTSASGDPVLSSIRWYGSDGAAHSDSLLVSPRAAAFAMRVGFPNPKFGVDEGARDIWQPLAERIRTRTGVEPDAFALTVYDAVWVVARGYVASGATPNIDQLKHAFTTAAFTQYGATGWTVLNPAGDRQYGDFDFWAVREMNGRPAWARVARYETRTGRIVRQPAATSLRLSTGRTLSLQDVAGRWNVRATPEVGDTMTTKLMLTVTTDGECSMLYPPNRDPIPGHLIAFGGDSLVLEWGPYMSARRAGLRAVSHDVYRLVDGRLVGYSLSHYLTAPETTIRLRLEGTRAP